MQVSLNPPLEAAPLVTTTSPAQVPDGEPIVGKYVRLERLSPDHFPQLWESIGAHPEIWTWWPDGPFTLPEFNKEMHDFLAQMPNDLFNYAVFPLSGPHQGVAAGMAMALSENRETHRTAELGAFFGPWLKRTRAATETLFLLGDLMFMLGHRRLGWKTNSFNLDSRRAAERFGYVQEGCIRQDRIYKGRSRDTVVYGVIDSEWPLCREALKLWLDDGNFDEEGKQKQKLEDIREGLKKKENI